MSMYLGKSHFGPLRADPKVVADIKEKHAQATGEKLSNQELAQIASLGEFVADGKANGYATRDEIENGRAAHAKPFIHTVANGYQRVLGSVRKREDGELYMGKYKLDAGGG